MADIKYTIIFDTKAAEQAAAKMDKAVGDMGKTAGSAKSPFTGLWKEVAGGIVVADLAKGAIKGLTDFVLDSVKAASESEAAEAALKSALAATGREVGNNTKHFISYANSLQKSTVYNDEAIKGAQTLLLQLTNLDRQGIDKATKGAIGLASVLGIDLQSAAMMVAKAMEGNYAALGRYGIKIKETGTEEEKRAELLEKLQGFYKRATDATDTFAGRQAQLKNNIDDFKESVGRAITENKQFNKTIADLSLGFQYLAENTGFVKTALDGLFAVALGPVSQILLKLLGDMADKQKELNKQQEDGQKWADEFNTKLIAVVKSGENLSNSPILGFFTKLAYQTKEGGVQLGVTEEFAKRLGITLKSQLVEKIIETESALRRLKGSAEATPGAISKLEKTLKDLKEQLSGVGKAGKTLDDILGKLGLRTLKQVDREVEELRKDQAALTKAFKDGKISADVYTQAMGATDKKIKDLTVTLTTKVLPAARNFEDVLKKSAEAAKNLNEAAYGKKAQDNIRKWLQENEKTINSVLLVAQQAVALMSALWQNYYAQRTQELDAWYEQQKKAIELSTMSEEEKQAALEKLDDDYQKRKLNLQREAFKKQQQAAVVSAVINTAEAITKALTGVPPPYCYALAALSAALGAVQIALIKKQPIPLAKGAIFDRPTFLAGEAGREAMLPVDPFVREIRSAIIEGMKARGGDAGASVHVYIGQEELDARMIKVVQRRSLGGAWIPARAIGGRD